MVAVACGTTASATYPLLCPTLTTGFGSAWHLAMIEVVNTVTGENVSGGVQRGRPERWQCRLGCQRTRPPMRHLWLPDQLPSDFVCTHAPG